MEQAVTDEPPQACVICSDERQYVRPSGPGWTTSQALVAWSHALGGVPVYVAGADAAWVQRDDSAILLWDEPFEVVPGVPVRQVGGHFRGQTVARWTGADGAGVLLAGDAERVVRLSAQRQVEWITG